MTEVFSVEAIAQVDTYLSTHPGITRDVIQPGQGATNRVIFAHQGDKPVVFKVFCEDERKQRETFAMLHWQSTGLVPRLLDDINERMILMSYIPGVYLYTLRERNGDTAWFKACHEVGAAIATLTTVPLGKTIRRDFESRFYDDAGSLEGYWDHVLSLACGVQRRDPDFQDAYWGESIDLLAEQRTSILAQTRLLYHQDVSNLHVTSEGFQGMFDLEMCRVGCEAMQIASAVRMLEGSRDAWLHFKAGWEQTTGHILDADAVQVALAGVHLLAWREITRYMSYDGTPGSGYEWASPADPEQYRDLLDSVGEILI